MGNPMKKDLELVQVGEQTAIGTSVPATWQLAMPMDFSDISVVETPPVMAGRMMANAGGVRQTVEKATAFTIPASPVTAEDLKTLMHFALDRTPGTDGSEVEATNVLLAHKWTKAFTAVADIKGMTIEHRQSDGLTNFDNEYADGFFAQFTLAWGRGQLVSFAGNGIAQHRVAGAIADLSTPFPHQDLAYFPSSRAVLYIDDTWATSGTTSFDAEMLSGSLTYDTGLVAIHAADGNTDLAYALIEQDGGVQKATLELVLLAKAGAADAFRAEQAKAESDPSALRGIRVLFTGVPAAGGSTSRIISLRMTAMHVPDTYHASPAEDGQQIVTMTLESHPDPTDSDWFELTTYGSDIDNAPATTA